jgi:hypothetical protein
VLLTPDEFVASLNPEFLVEWAIPRLGSDHPAVVEAKALLLDRRFVDALVAIRAGLVTLLGD